MKIRFQPKIALMVVCAFFFCLTAANCVASESATKAKAAKNPYPYIINTLPVDGYVKKLIIPKSSPNFLYALVRNDGGPKPTDKTGLYIFDISDVTKIGQITFFPVTSPIGMDMSPDEKTLFLYSTYFQGQDPKGWYGVIALDINNPKALREVGRVELDILKARLSADGKYLFVSERYLTKKNAERSIFHIFQVFHDSGPKLLASVKDPKRYSTPAYEFYPLPDGKHLLVQNVHKNLTVFDISNPLSPKVELERESHIGDPKAILPNGILLLTDERAEILGKFFPKTERLGALQGNYSGAEVTFVSDETIYLSTVDNALHIIDVSDPKSPKAISEYVMPQYISSAAPARNSNIVFVGLNGSIMVIDPDKAVVTSARLRAAHADALRQYHHKDVKQDYEKTRIAINLLEAAGIRTAVKERPRGLSDKAFASILNDYGFFLEKVFRMAEAIEIYKKAITLDPTRSVAYLNLGGCLQNQLPVVESFQEKIELTKEIKHAYLQYKRLKGKSTPAIDSFLSLNIVDHPIDNFCEYVAAYANQGRLGEIFGSGNSVLKSDESGTMHVEIEYGGTAHIPWVSLTDNSTNKGISEADDGNEMAEEDGNDDNSWTQRIELVPFSDGHHLLYHNYKEYLVRSSPVGAARNKGNACRFSVHVTESFDKKSVDTELCKRIQASSPEYIRFDQPHSITNEMIGKSGFSETGVGKAGKIDFDNDGKEETLVELLYASGAGPGCGYDFFDLLNAEEDGFSNSKKRQLLHELQGIRLNERHPVPHCQGNVTGWFRYNGITYYETKYPGEQPEYEGQEFHTVSYIKNGKIHRVCEASFRVRIEGEYRQEAIQNRSRESQADLSLNERLMRAAGQHRLEAVKNLLAQGADVNAKWEDGRTVLMQAVLSTNLELVRFLLDKGADVNATDQSGTALMYAAERGQFEIMKVLLDKGADVNARGNSGITALIYAARSRNVEAVKLLIDKGADVKAKTESDETAFLSAAALGNLELVKLLVDKGANIHDEGAYGGTALMSAAFQGNLELMKFLVDKGVDVRTKNQKGDTALMSAVVRTNFEVLQFLIDRGVDVNAMNKYGDTALMVAAARGRIEVVKLLIYKGADVNAMGRLGQTPLLKATEGNRLDIMKLLIDKGAQVKGNIGAPVLIEAVRKNNLDLIKFLLNHGADVNAKDRRDQGVILNATVEIRIGGGADPDDATDGGKTALMTAASAGNLELITFLIDQGADVYAKDLYGGTVLMYAASQSNIEVLKFFIDKGLDVKSKNNKGDTTLMSAASGGNLEVMKFLVDNGVDVNAANKNGDTALTAHASQQNLDVFQFLIDRGADVNAKSKDGTTVLMRVSTGGNLRAVKFLISKGADVNAVGRHGETALLFATMTDRLEIMKFLVDKGADVNIKGNNSYTPLMEAARNGHLEAVKFLIDKGADVNARDERGRMVIRKSGMSMEIPFDGGTDLDARTMVGSTALMAAVESGNLEVVKVLIANGADLNVRCRHGETALGLASARNKPEIVQYLEAHGAKPSDESPRSNPHGAKPSGAPPPLPPIEGTKLLSR
ncbi:ankyrin repeat domain-containing protein [Desulfomonile tiedjei]|uniref:Ankyrin repeat-containing protein n=1 Tax=Desulfomonile tiedjei (strain ATCC 49306 / DSM 6799 / DCB-1) TaxID=706587 RepID=I4C2F4_DESTA|nr:ankyrin repeat domain-containing protein [Desulfomonile tiedjei]AFM23745.1 ankyrin repeat-containing protein [Desulfomonile tiedjei DSM 6799]